MMKGVEEKLKGTTEVRWGRMLNSDLFLYLLDHEVKRARRYQNFLSILTLKLSTLSEGNGNLETSCQMLAKLLTEEIRETDIMGRVSGDMIFIILPYADSMAGSQAKIRFEGSIKCLDFKSTGYEVMIDQVSYPMHGTDTMTLIKKALGSEMS